jgi:hypothetical protein
VTCTVTMKMAVCTHVRVARFRPKLSRRHKAVNRAHAKIRARRERGIATLQTWKILVNLRCCPRRAPRDVRPSWSCTRWKPTATHEEHGAVLMRTCGKGSVRRGVDPWRRIGHRPRSGNIRHTTINEATGM